MQSHGHWLISPSLWAWDTRWARIHDDSWARIHDDSWGSQSKTRGDGAKKGNLGLAVDLVVVKHVRRGAHKLNRRISLLSNGTGFWHSDG